MEITGVNLVEFVKKVYELSVPQGLGFSHAIPGPLPDEEAKSLINEDSSDGVVISMDYVHGRACKMTVFKEGGKLVIGDNWFDHTNSQFAELLESVGMGEKLHVVDAHACACGCVKCQTKRKNV